MFGCACVCRLCVCVCVCVCACAIVPVVVLFCIVLCILCCLSFPPSTLILALFETFDRRSFPSLQPPLPVFLHTHAHVYEAPRTFNALKCTMSLWKQINSVRNDDCKAHPFANYRILESGNRRFDMQCSVAYFKYNYIAPQSCNNQTAKRSRCLFSWLAFVINLFVNFKMLSKILKGHNTLKHVCSFCGNHD